jgi:acetolactate synthase-1/2/3 large subunit
MNEVLADKPCDQALSTARRAHFARRHQAYQQQLREAEQAHGDRITAPYLLSCLRAQLPADALVLNEGITNYKVIFDHLGLAQAGSLLTSGGGSLGWHGGAALGVKLARPDKTVIAITGDGSYLFSAPAVVHWMARRYQTPFLQIVLNNDGWNAPRFSTLALHPDGYASKAADLGLSFAPAPDYAGIAAAAGGAFARLVRQPEEVPEALAAALAAVREEQRCAVLDVWLAGK